MIIPVGNRLAATFSPAEIIWTATVVEKRMRISPAEALAQPAAGPGTAAHFRGQRSPHTPSAVYECTAHTWGKCLPSSGVAAAHLSVPGFIVFPGSVSRHTSGARHPDSSRHGSRSRHGHQHQLAPNSSHFSRRLHARCQTTTAKTLPGSHVIAVPARIRFVFQGAEAKYAATQN